MQRLTGTLIPNIWQPWHYYFTEMWREFGNSGITWFVAAGLVTPYGAIQSVADGLTASVVLLWAVVPLAIISERRPKALSLRLSVSPPVALAAGYLVGLVVQLAPSVVRRALGWVEDALMDRFAALVTLVTSGDAARSHRADRDRCGSWRSLAWLRTRGWTLPGRRSSRVPACCVRRW